MPVARMALNDTVTARRPWPASTRAKRSTKPEAAQ